MCSVQWWASLLIRLLYVKSIGKYDLSVSCKPGLVTSRCTWWPFNWGRTCSMITYLIWFRVYFDPNYNYMTFFDNIWHVYLIIGGKLSLILTQKSIMTLNFNIIQRVLALCYFWDLEKIRISQKSYWQNFNFMYAVTK